MCRRWLDAHALVKVVTIPAGLLGTRNVVVSEKGRGIVLNESCVVYSASDKRVLLLGHMPVGKRDDATLATVPRAASLVVESL